MQATFSTNAHRLALPPCRGDHAAWSVSAYCCSIRYAVVSQETHQYSPHYVPGTQRKPTFVPRMPTVLAAWGLRKVPRFRLLVGSATYCLSCFLLVFLVGSFLRCFLFCSCAAFFVLWCRLVMLLCNLMLFLSAHYRFAFSCLPIDSSLHCDRHVPLSMSEDDAKSAGERAEKRGSFRPFECTTPSGRPRRPVQHRLPDPSGEM